MQATYLTPDEAAIILRVHAETVKRWLRKKELHGRKFGRIWRIPVGEVVERKEK